MRERDSFIFSEFPLNSIYYMAIYWWNLLNAHDNPLVRA